MKEIPLTKEYVTLVDDDDYEAMAALKWSAMISKRTVYAVAYLWRNGKNTSARMHRIILGLAENPKIKVDRRNHNGLDSQRHNLRACSQAQNAANARKTSSKTTSVYKGVWLTLKETNGEQRYARLGGESTSVLSIPSKMPPGHTTKQQPRGLENLRAPILNACCAGSSIQETRSETSLTPPVL